MLQSCRGELIGILAAPSVAKTNAHATASAQVRGHTGDERKVGAPMAAFDTSRRLAALQQLARFRANADIELGVAAPDL